MLALHRLTRRNSLLDLARECGDHLVANRSISGSGLKSWKTTQGKMLAGYSHGAAGIAHALIELHRATGIEQFREAAMEACRFENTLFSKQKGNWPNLTGMTQDRMPVFWNTWCHGAIGIGLGRIACLDVPGVPLQGDIDEALKTTLLEKFAVLDHPCCGNMGRVELFLCAGLRFCSSAYFEKANQSQIPSCAEPGKTDTTVWGRTNPFLRHGSIKVSPPLAISYCDLRHRRRYPPSFCGNSECRIARRTFFVGKKHYLPGGEKRTSLELSHTGQKLVSIHIITNKTLYLQEFGELVPRDLGLGSS